MVLQKFEERLERMVDTVFSTAFRGELQPVEIGRKMIREMDLRRRVAVKGIIAPNSFKIYLSPHDTERFSGFEVAFVNELAAAVNEHAGEEGYILLGEVQVVLAEDSDLKPGRYDIETEVVEGLHLERDAVVVLPDAHEVLIGNFPLVIGRAADCNIVLHDQNVSRRHAEIRKRDSNYFVKDLGSTNGTRVNGDHVKEQRLGDGDQIQVGSTVLQFRGL